MGWGRGGGGGGGGREREREREEGARQAGRQAGRQTNKDRSKQTSMQARKQLTKTTNQTKNSPLSRVQVQNIGLRQAYEIFLQANRVVWGRSTNFQDGACGAMKSAYDLGYSVTAVQNAFAVVDIDLSSCQYDSFAQSIAEGQSLLSGCSGCSGCACSRSCCSCVTHFFLALLFCVSRFLVLLFLCISLLGIVVFVYLASSGSFSCVSHFLV